MSLEDGQVVMRFEDIASGEQVSSISRSVPLSVLAVDAEHRRFAVAGPEEVIVVQIDPASA